jgi:hypothetical protein
MLLSSAASGLTFMALYVLVSIVTIETFFLCN